MNSNTSLLFFFFFFFSFSLIEFITSFQGSATTYTLSPMSKGNCNFNQLDSTLGMNYYVAMNHIQMNTLDSCGKCIKATSSNTGKSVIVYLVDKCPTCNYGDLDLSPEAFKELTGETTGIFNINWDFITCPNEYINGPIGYCLKGGSNQHWTAIQLTNFKKEIKSLSINNILANGPKTNGIDGFYHLVETQIGLNSYNGNSLWYQNLKVTIQAEDGEEIAENISFSSIGSCTKGTQQFGSSQEQEQKKNSNTKREKSLRSYDITSDITSNTKETTSNNKETEAAGAFLAMIAAAMNLP